MMLVIWLADTTPTLAIPYKVHSYLVVSEFGC